MGSSGTHTLLSDGRASWPSESTFISEIESTSVSAGAKICNGFVAAATRLGRSSTGESALRLASGSLQKCSPLNRQV